MWEGGQDAYAYGRRNTGLNLELSGRTLRSILTHDVRLVAYGVELNNLSS